MLLDSPVKGLRLVYTQRLSLHFHLIFATMFLKMQMLLQNLFLMFDANADTDVMCKQGFTNRFWQIPVTVTGFYVEDNTRVRMHYQDRK